MNANQPQPETRNLCGMCCKDMGERATRYCEECNKKIAERAAPKDCKFCQGKESVHATYQMEGDYGAPYICHTCKKDQYGYTWEHIPADIVELNW
jgi:hypothetical protein